MSQAEGIAGFKKLGIAVYLGRDDLPEHLHQYIREDDDAVGPAGHLPPYATARRNCAEAQPSGRWAELSLRAGYRRVARETACCSGVAP